MDGDDLGASVGIGVKQRVRVGDHQMRIKQLVGNMAKRLDHRRTKSQVRHKMAIHHIKVDPVCSSTVDSRYFVGEAGEIRCENGRGDNYIVGHISLR